MVRNVGITMFLTILMLKNKAFFDIMRRACKEGKEQQSVAPTSFLR